MYALIGTDPARESTGSPFDASATHGVSNAGATPATSCGPACDTLPRSALGNSPSRLGNSPPGLGASSPFGAAFGPAGGPAAIMAAFTAFVQQMFGQIATWMQHATLPGTSAPPAPRYLESQGSGGLPPAGP